jgi:hypothetical protein
MQQANQNQPQPLRISHPDMGVWEFLPDRNTWIPWTEDDGQFAGPEMTSAQLREYGHLWVIA